MSEEEENVTQVTHDESIDSEDEEGLQTAKETRKNGSTTASKGLSLTKSFRKSKLFGFLAPRPHDIACPYTDEMVRLEDMILSAKGRPLLIHDSLKLKGDIGVKVRFITAVDQYDEATSSEDKKRLGSKIVETFVEGKMFHLTALDDELGQVLAEGRYGFLLDARRRVLEELSLDGEVMKIVDNIEGLV